MYKEMQPNNAKRNKKKKKNYRVIYMKKKNVLNSKNH